MEHVYGLGFFLWPLIFLVLAWGIFALWPSRGYRSYRTRTTDDADWEDPYSMPFDLAGVRYRGLGPNGYRRSDLRIAEDINDRLFINGDIDARKIEVRVESGHVTLIGSVASLREKRIAEWVADSVPGVEEVSNRIALEGASERAA